MTVQSIVLIVSPAFNAILIFVIAMLLDRRKG